MKRLFFFLVFFAAVLAAEASLVRYPSATTIVPSALQPATIAVRPLQGQQMQSSVTGASLRGSQKWLAPLPASDPQRPH